MLLGTSLGEEVVKIRLWFQSGENSSVETEFIYKNTQFEINALVKKRRGSIQPHTMRVERETQVCSADLFR
ncbi:hypothetical protein BM528_12535 [Alteromonas sp. RW2A1]|jgi:hypothetical protein|nr:hypothetical protein BM528_12535 [Alteromonas sp. RW2A1]